jgi:hypothetical protein
LTSIPALAGQLSTAGFSLQVGVTTNGAINISAARISLRLLLSIGLKVSTPRLKRRQPPLGSDRRQAQR